MEVEFPLLFRKARNYSSLSSIQNLVRDINLNLDCRPACDNNSYKSSSFFLSTIYVVSALKIKFLPANCPSRGLSG